MNKVNPLIKVKQVVIKAATLTPPTVLVLEQST